MSVYRVESYERSPRQSDERGDRLGADLAARWEHLMESTEARAYMEVWGQVGSRGNAPVQGIRGRPDLPLKLTKFLELQGKSVKENDSQFKFVMQSILLECVQ